MQGFRSFYEEREDEKELLPQGSSPQHQALHRGILLWMKLLIGQEPLGLQLRLHCNDRLRIYSKPQGEEEKFLNQYHPVEIYQTVTMNAIQWPNRKEFSLQ